MIARRLAALSTSLRSMNTILAPSKHQRLLDAMRCLSTSAAAEAAGSGGGGKGSSFRRRAVPIVLISITGGVALSAVNDLAIFHGCSSMAVEKASENQKIIEAFGEPLSRGSWYDSSLAVSHKRRTVSCTFPVSGPHGSGVFHLKAVRCGDDSLFSFLRHRDWDILILEALLHVSAADGEVPPVRISVAGASPSPNASMECKDCKSPPH